MSCLRLSGFVVLHPLSDSGERCVLTQNQEQKNQVCVIDGVVYSNTGLKIIPTLCQNIIDLFEDEISLTIKTQKVS